MEEVISGVRLQAEVSDAEPGKYIAVFHDSGSCEKVESAKLGSSANLMSSSKQVKGSNGQAFYPLGDMKVDSDGDGHGRWLTAVGNLRKEQAGSLLNGVFALYRAKSDELGELMACVVVKNQEDSP